MSSVAFETVLENTSLTRVKLVVNWAVSSTLRPKAPKLLAAIVVASSTATPAFVAKLIVPGSAAILCSRSNPASASCSIAPAVWAAENSVRAASRRAISPISRKALDVLSSPPGNLVTAFVMFLSKAINSSPSSLTAIPAAARPL